jgi:hypothetical protein
MEIVQAQQQGTIQSCFFDDCLHILEMPKEILGRGVEIAQRAPISKRGIALEECLVEGAERVREGAWFGRTMADSV